MKKKVVYIGLSADILHEGHINILKISAKLGDVTVGLLTDKAISTYKKFPHFKYKQRATILKGLKYVNNIIPQDTLEYGYVRLRGYRRDVGTIPLRICRRGLMF